MLIKQQTLASHLKQNIAAAYILFGQDHFLLQEAAESIKSTWKTSQGNETEQTIIHINTPADWGAAKDEANSYSLFANAVLVDIRYEKKTLEAAGKEFLTNYLQNINPSCLILLRAPNLPLKQLQWLAHHNNLHLVQATPLAEAAMLRWIAEKLQQCAFKFGQDIPILIHQYTQGNMLACAQAIDKLQLLAEANSLLTTDFVREQLVDQCNYQLFDLADACLAQNPDKVIQLLRHAYQTKVEPTLILWLLAQEIRLLVQLFELTSHQAIPFNTACSQLKIWPQRARLYQAQLKKIQMRSLLQLLQFCKTIDERIKSTQNNQIWQSLEQIALSLCLARQVGNFA